MQTYLKLAALAALTFTFSALPVRQTAAADDDDQYSFKVHNTTDAKITKLLASEDGKEYGSFDIGKGIPSGETVTLNWAKSTNEKGCKWYFKAVFADGEESKSKKFDFCEEDLELEF